MKTTKLCQAPAFFFNKARNHQSQRRGKASIPTLNLTHHNDTNRAVNVVHTLVHNITQTACNNPIILPHTNHSTITVTKELLCITIVLNIPVTKPLKVVFVEISINFCKNSLLEPSTLSSKRTNP